MSAQVEIVAGTATETLLQAAISADPDWRDIVAAGRSTHDHLVASAGRGLADQLAEVGRLGWINLLGLVVGSADAVTLDELLARVRAVEPARLHAILVGGDRRQLRLLLDVADVDRALAGGPDQRLALAEAIRSDDNVLHATDWLLAATSRAVHERVVDVLTAWRELVLPPAAETELAEELAASVAEAVAARELDGSDALCNEVTGGVQYAPPDAGPITLVPSPVVTPVLVFVDGHQGTVIAHPPLSFLRARPDVAARLAELGRAVGDKTRIRLLQLLADGPTTAVELARSLGAPRTTLLHHLAILRAAGLIEVRVTSGAAAEYRLLHEGFDELASSARRFTGRYGPATS